MLYPIPIGLFYCYKDGGGVSPPPSQDFGPLSVEFFCPRNLYQNYFREDMSIFGLYQQQNDLEIWKHVDNPIYLFRINSVWVVSDIKTGDQNYNLEISYLNSNPKIKDLHSNHEIKDSYFNLESKDLKSNQKIKDLNTTLEVGDLNATLEFIDPNAILETEDPLEIVDLKPNFKLGNLSQPTPVRLINRFDFISLIFVSAVVSTL